MDGRAIANSPAPEEIREKVAIGLQEISGRIDNLYGFLVSEDYLTSPKNIDVLILVISRALSVEYLLDKHNNNAVKGIAEQNRAKLFLEGISQGSRENKERDFKEWKSLIQAYSHRTRQPELAFRNKADSGNDLEERVFEQRKKEIYELVLFGRDSAKLQEFGLYRSYTRLSKDEIIARKPEWVADAVAFGTLVDKAITLLEDADFDLKGKFNQSLFARYREAIKGEKFEPLYEEIDGLVRNSHITAKDYEAARDFMLRQGASYSEEIIVNIAAVSILDKIGAAMGYNLKDGRGRGGKPPSPPKE